MSSTASHLITMPILFAKESLPHPSHVDVLVIDDDEISVRRLCELLELIGLSYASASNGLDALKRLQRLQPRIILLDICMPVMDGNEFLLNIKSHSEFQHLPVIFVSGENPDELRCPVARTIPFFRKPVEYYSLLLKIKTLITPQVALSIPSS